MNNKINEITTMIKNEASITRITTLFIGFSIFLIILSLFYILFTYLSFLQPKNNWFLSFTFVVVVILLAIVVSINAHKHYTKEGAKFLKTILQSIIENLAPIRLIIYALIFLSWYATSTGLLQIIQDQFGIKEANNVTIIIYFYVFILTVAMAYLLRMWISPVTMYRRFVAIIGWLFLAIFSISFSFSFFWRVLESVTQLEKQIVNKTNQVKQSISQIDAGLNDMQLMLKRLADESSYKSLKEAGYRLDKDGNKEKVPNWGGDTCGTVTQRIRGSRAIMREETADLFNRDQKFFEDIKIKISIDINELQSYLDSLKENKIIASKNDTSDQFWKESIAKINSSLNNIAKKYTSLVNGANFKSMIENYSELGKKFSSTDKSFQGQSGKFSCRDSSLANNLIVTSELLSNFPNPKFTAIENYYGTKATKKALSRFYESLFGLIKSNSDKDDYPNNNVDVITPEEQAILRSEIKNRMDSIYSNDSLVNDSIGLSKSDRTALLIALLVDGLLLIFMLTDPRSSRFNAYFEKNRNLSKEDPLDDLRDFTEAVINPQFLNFSQFLVQIDGSDYIAIPRLKLKKSQKAIHALLIMMKDTGIAKESLSMSGKKVIFTKHVQKQILEQNKELAKDGEECGYFIYRLAPDVFSDILRRTISKRKKTES